MGPKIFSLMGAALGCLSVVFGAFARHGLEHRLPGEMLEIFETAVRYQMYHALALLAVGWVAVQYGHPAVTTSGWLFIAGSVIFSGSLYLLALSGVKGWGAVTPVGGLLLVGGWLFLFIGILRAG